jgi:hypothetical protein
MLGSSLPRSHWERCGCCFFIAQDDRNLFLLEPPYFPVLPEAVRYLLAGAVVHGTYNTKPSPFHEEGCAIIKLSRYDAYICVVTSLV